MESREKIGLYYEGERCPACSSEIDKGGRMILHRGKKQKYLKCSVCKYLSSESKFGAYDTVQKYFDSRVLN